MGVRQLWRSTDVRFLDDHRTTVHAAAGEARGDVVDQKPDIGAWRRGSGIHDLDVAAAVVGAGEISRAVVADEKDARRMEAIGDGERAAGIGWICRRVGEAAARETDAGEVD